MLISKAFASYGAVTEAQTRNGSSGVEPHCYIQIRYRKCWDSSAISSANAQGMRLESPIGLWPMFSFYSLRTDNVMPCWCDADSGSAVLKKDHTDWGGFELRVALCHSGVKVWRNDFVLLNVCWVTSVMSSSLMRLRRNRLPKSWMDEGLYCFSFLFPHCAGRNRRSSALHFVFVFWHCNEDGLAGEKLV